MKRRGKNWRGNRMFELDVDIALYPNKDQVAQKT